MNQKDQTRQMSTETAGLLFWEPWPPWQLHLWGFISWSGDLYSSLQVEPFISSFGFISPQFLLKVLSSNQHGACVLQQSRRIPGIRRAAPATYRVRIALRHGEEPWEMLSWPVTREASMRGCIGGGMQPPGGMKQANENTSPTKGKKVRACICARPAVFLGHLRAPSRPFFFLRFTCLM